MTIYHIQIKRGLKADLPESGEVGEPFLTTDTHELYVGQGSGLPLVPLSVTDINIDDGSF